jgi:hypothetical protein
MLMKKTRKEHKEKLPVAQTTHIYVSFGCLPHPHTPSHPIPGAVHSFGMVCPQTMCIYTSLEPRALPSSSYPILLLPISTPQGVAHSSGWGCCGAVVGVVVAIVIIIVVIITSL